MSAPLAKVLPAPDLDTVLAQVKDLKSYDRHRLILSMIREYKDKYLGIVVNLRCCKRCGKREMFCENFTGYCCNSTDKREYRICWECDICFDCGSRKDSCEYCEDMYEEESDSDSEDTSYSEDSE